MIDCCIINETGVWNKAPGDFWSTLTSPYVSQGNIRQFKQKIWQSIRKHLCMILSINPFFWVHGKKWQVLVPISSPDSHYPLYVCSFNFKMQVVLHFFFNPVFLQLTMVQSLMLVSVNLFTMLQRDFRRLCLRKIFYDPLLNGLH